MESGTVDVRTRDTERHGKMRVDELAKHLETLKPAPSPSFNNFYKNAWNPDNYKESNSSSKQAAESSNKGNAKHAELEKKLGQSQWFGGSNPSQADREALIQLSGT